MTNVFRRDVVATVATSITGCVSYNESKARNTRRMSEHGYPSIKIVANEFPAPGISPVGDVERQYSDEQPALIRLGLQNDTNEKVTINTGQPLPFAAYHNDPEEPNTMYLITEGEQGFLHNKDEKPIIPDAPEDGCWRIRPTGGHGGALVGFYLQPEEAREARYVVLADSSDSECLPAGDYHFSSTVHVDEVGNTFDWNLTVMVQ